MTTERNALTGRILKRLLVAMAVTLVLLTGFSVCANEASRGGVVTILGDSLFDNNGKGGLIFGDWLEAQGIYDTVYNHAFEGSGFGNTFTYRKGYSTYDLLTKSGDLPDHETSYEEIREHIAESDYIYVSAGGNDIMSEYLYGGQTINGIKNQPEDKLKKKVKQCFEKINELNPNAIIFLQEPSDIEHAMKEGGAVVGGEIPMDIMLKASKAYNQISQAVAEADANILINEHFINDFSYHTLDGLHPQASSANMAYYNVVYGQYRDKKMNEILITIDNGTPDEDDLKNAVSCVKNNLLAFDAKLVVATKHGDSDVAIQTADRSTYANVHYAYQFMDMSQAKKNGKIIVNLVGISDKNVEIQKYAIDAE